MPTFPIPSDFQAPPDAKEGEEFDSVATFKMEGGNLTLVAIAGSEVSYAEEAPEKEKESGEDDDDFMGVMKKRMEEK